MTLFPPNRRWLPAACTHEFLDIDTGYTPSPENWLEPLDNFGYRLRDHRTQRPEDWIEPLDGSGYALIDRRSSEFLIERLQDGQAIDFFWIEQSPPRELLIWNRDGTLCFETDRPDPPPPPGARHVVSMAADPMIYGPGLPELVELIAERALELMADTGLTFRFQITFMAISERPISFIFRNGRLTA